MDTKSHLQMIIDSLNEHCDLIMLSTHKEPSGSILLKARFVEDKNGGHCGGLGEATHKETLYLKRKTSTQIKRDLKRAKDHNEQPRSYELRSHSSKSESVENPRSEGETPEKQSMTSISEVTSPVERFGSVDVCMASPYLAGVQDEVTPEPPMRENDQASEKCDSIVTSEAEEISKDLLAVDPLGPLDQLDSSNTDSNIQAPHDTNVSDSHSTPVHDHAKGQLSVHDFMSDAYFEKFERCVQQALRNRSPIRNEQSSAPDPNDDT